MVSPVKSVDQQRPNETVKRAHLGESNAFVYDDVEKKWINKNAPVEPTKLSPQTGPPQSNHLIDKNDAKVSFPPSQPSADQMIPGPNMYRAVNLRGSKKKTDPTASFQMPVAANVMEGSGVLHVPHESQNVIWPASTCMADVIRFIQY